MNSEILTAVESNGTEAAAHEAITPEVEPEADPLAEAQALILKDRQTRAENIVKALEANRCELQPILTIGNQTLVLTNIAGIPAGVQIVAK